MIDKIDFKKLFKVAPIISTAFIVIGLVMSMFVGFNQGIDFSGGTVMEIKLKEAISGEEVRTITDSVDKSVNITFIGEDKATVQIKTQKDLDNSERLDLFNKFKVKYSLEDSAFTRAEQIGPAVGAEIKRNALISVFIASIFMLIYISVRFKLSYGIAAIVALIHDVLFVVAVYAIFRIPLNSPFVAAMLTVVGYSVNDTIVIFDRIRENMQNAKRNSEEEMAISSIKQTLGRSINTSLTTLIAIFALYVLGVESIKEFTFPLLMGIAVGAYSSLFIASPVWLYITKKMKLKAK
ncbi:MAG: protein translocase subunit SecF [Filifactoraceae bacterium]